MIILQDRKDSIAKGIQDFKSMAWKNNINHDSILTKRNPLVKRRDCKLLEWKQYLRHKGLIHKYLVCDFIEVAAYGDC